MKKQITFIATLLFLGAIAASALGASASPTFWAQIKDSGRRLEVFAANTRDSNFQCDLNVQFETADSALGSFRCKAKVYGKAKEALVCSNTSPETRITAIGRINQSCNLY